MSRIKDLKNSQDNHVNIIEIIELFSPEGKSKYTDMLLRIMNNTPNLKEHGDEIIKFITTNFDFIDKEDLKKYTPIQLMLMYKFIDTYFSTEDLQKFRKFSEYNERNLIEKNDLSTYKTFDDIITQLDISEIKAEMKQLENEVVRVHEDDEWILVRPMTFFSSKKYGANTKWCTTSESNPEYFLKYAERGVLIYCMNKRTGYKVASFYSLKSSDPEFSFWNQKDTKIESMDSELSDEMLRIIRDVCKDPSTISNRRLLNQTQLDKENKVLEKYMSRETILKIVSDYAMDTLPAHVVGRLQQRIQNALRREESEINIAPYEDPIPMSEIAHHFNGVNVSMTRSIDDIDGGPEEELETESPF
jgi:hypothetical protein